MKEIACIKCGLTASVDEGGSIGAWMEQSGFCAAFNQANGLEVVWTCPRHTKQVMHAVDYLINVYGPITRYIGLGTLVSRFEKMNAKAEKKPDDSAP